MPNLLEPDQLTDDQIEEVEKVSTRMVFQALRDFLPEAIEIFKHSPDNQKDVAEDITREALNKLPGFPISERIFGVMDFKRAGYAFCPSFSVRQALLVDSKAEKDSNKARLQVSQTSLRVRQIRAGKTLDRKPGLFPIYELGQYKYLVTTIFVHYHYRDIKKQNEYRNLLSITIATLPNGKLESLYVPNERDTIWDAGPDAPTRGEKFRVRLNFQRLKRKRAWRVQRLFTNVASNHWSE
jgi:hypothetical protein